MRRTRLLVADPLGMLRSGVRGLLARESELEVVEASDLDGVVDAIEAGPPEVALVDLDLPPVGGLAALERLAETGACHPLAWSFDPAPEEVLGAIRAGANGYLTKSVSPAELLGALRALARGEAVLSPALTLLLVGALRSAERRERARERAAVLTAREREVLELVAGGASNRQVASRLAISEFTAKRHVQNILRKLELPSRTAAAGFYAAASEPAA